MAKRMQVFHCKAIPNCRTGLEMMYRLRAMEIIHWITEQLGDLPNFDDHDIVSTYGQEEEDRLQVLASNVVPHQLLPNVDLPALRCVDESILPHRSIVRAHLDVYDAVQNDHLAPYRLTKPSYNLDSEEYHLSVYKNLIGENYKQAVDVNAGVDVEMLFRNRKEQGWKGTDSLYHAWLMINHGLTHPLFDVRKFASRHPDFRQVRLKMLDLSPTWTQTGKSNIFLGLNRGMDYRIWICCAQLWIIPGKNWTIHAKLFDSHSTYPHPYFQISSYFLHIMANPSPE